MERCQMDYSVATVPCFIRRLFVLRVRGISREGRTLCMPVQGTDQRVFPLVAPCHESQLTALEKATVPYRKEAQYNIGLPK